MIPPDLSRFWSKVAKGTGCWKWTGATHPKGYGSIAVGGGRPAYAHRVSWEIAHGPIPTGMFVCHRCDNPGCVNPEHLFLGSNRENMADRNAKCRQVRGERSWSAKVTEDDVRSIRRRRKLGERQVDLMKEYGLSKAAIAALTHRRTWRHVA